MPEISRFRFRYLASALLAFVAPAAWSGHGPCDTPPVPALPPGLTDASRGAAEWLDPYHSLQRASSYARLILDNQIRGISRPCREALGRVYRTGQTLSSQKLHDASKPIHDWRYSSFFKRSPEFYHWTNSQDDFANASSGHWDSNFRYIRSKSIDLYYGVNYYVAADRASSRQFGDKMVTLRLSPEARVIRKGSPECEAAIDEIRARFPEVATGCRGLMREELFQLIGEDSGIDVLSYHSEAVPDETWFQVMSPAHIEGYLPER